MKQKLVEVTINRGEGLKQTYRVPLWAENNLGFFVGSTLPNQQPDFTSLDFGFAQAQWVPKHSKCVQSRLV